MWGIFDGTLGVSQSADQTLWTAPIVLGSSCRSADSSASVALPIENTSKEQIKLPSGELT